jgi:hypothetical protein
MKQAEALWKAYADLVNAREVGVDADIPEY